MQQIVGKYQSRSLETMIDDLPEEVFDLGRQLPEFVRKNFTSSISPWPVKASILYNPDLKFIHFAIPGIVGLILQLFTVTLIASSLSRERESGTLFQIRQHVHRPRRRRIVRRHTSADIKLANQSLRKTRVLQRGPSTINEVSTWNRSSLFSSDKLDGNRNGETGYGHVSRDTASLEAKQTSTTNEKV